MLADVKFNYYKQINKNAFFVSYGYYDCGHFLNRLLCNNFFSVKIALTIF